MKILRVIVDELPLSTSRCDMSTIHWNPVTRVEVVTCQFSRLFWSVTTHALTTTLCPDCPLALEHDNKQIAESVM